ncbi:MAG: hypothetical protein IKZ19_06275 [Clostridia bacterium]|nr:hypothetical protein [Clostridia bacterium]
MARNDLPCIIDSLLSRGLISENDTEITQDGFFVLFKSLSAILSERNIFDFPNSEGKRLACENFFDDWFIYTVRDGSGYVCSLLKLREQEHDLESDAPADGDTPGVTISFIAFDCEVLLCCLDDPSDENRQKLNREINRVVSYRGQRHHERLKAYFTDSNSEGPYLVAELYTGYIASFAKNGSLDLPDRCKKTSGTFAKSSRIRKFINKLNLRAGRTVCDSEKIHIKDPACPDRYERAAILATHTGNTSAYSFAAEVEYHARYLLPVMRLRIPVYGKSFYDSAIRADMSAGGSVFECLIPFYRKNSRIVKKHCSIHKENSPF